MQLIFGYKLYSSWSLRPWLVLKHFNIAFEEVLIPLYEPGSKEKILSYSGSGKVPILVDGPVTVWESLAIIDYLADKYQNHAIWPQNLATKAMARSYAAEMHSGFAPLRAACSMNLGKIFPPRDYGEAVAADIKRITTLWNEAHALFHTQGPFLFGAFSAADAMFAPVVTRFQTYSIPLDPVSRAYCETILALPAYQDWLNAALKEPWTVASSEHDVKPLQDLRIHS
jgi:glutathione S-transferase